MTRGSGNGTALLSSEYVRMPPGKEDAQLQVGVTVQARHPDKQDYLDATVGNFADPISFQCFFVIRLDLRNMARCLMYTRFKRTVTVSKDIKYT